MFDDDGEMEGLGWGEVCVGKENLKGGRGIWKGETKWK
jgi:hypothetical protein